MLSSYTYAPDDTDLRADVETVRKYAGRSALSGLDAIELHFIRKGDWICQKTNNALFRLKTGVFSLHMLPVQSCYVSPSLNSVNGNGEVME